MDTQRIAVSGSSLGGYYATRAGCMEPRLAACIAHAAIRDLSGVLASWQREHPRFRHFLWVFSEDDMQAVVERAKADKFSINESPLR